MDRGPVKRGPRFYWNISRSDWSHIFSWAKLRVWYVFLDLIEES